MNPGVSGDSTSIGFFDAIAMGALSCSLVNLLASSASRPFLALLDDFGSKNRISNRLRQNRPYSQIMAKVEGEELFFVSLARDGDSRISKF